MWDIAIRLLQACGFAPLLDWQESFEVSRVPWYLFLLVAAILWADAHFYWIHRILHANRWLYKRVHSHHHESFNPDPMSALSFHPVEGMLYFSSLLFVFVCPMPGWGYHVMRLLLIVTPFGVYCAQEDVCFWIGCTQARFVLFTTPHDDSLTHLSFVVCLFVWKRVTQGTDFRKSTHRKSRRI